MGIRVENQIIKRVFAGLRFKAGVGSLVLFDAGLKPGATR